MRVFLVFAALMAAQTITAQPPRTLPFSALQPPMHPYGHGDIALSVDASEVAGKIRSLLGVNRGPYSWERRPGEQTTYLLDARVDRAFQYCGDLHPLGMFDRQSLEPKISGHSFAAWKMLLDTPERVRATGTDDRGYAVLAGKDEGNQRVRILISDFQSGYDSFTLAIKRLPWGAGDSFSVRQWLLDKEHRLDLVYESAATGNQIDLHRPFKAGSVSVVELARVKPPQNTRPEAQRGRSGPGPWDQDLLVYRVGPDGKAERLAMFPRAGVPTLARMKDGRLIAAHQHFPEDDAVNFDKVAVRFSQDEGRTWTPPQVIEVAGLPEGMRFPFDPTLVPLNDGRLRLYFTSVRGRRLDQNLPAIFSAVSTDGIHFTFEPGMRFGIQGRPVIDCAVALHGGVFHLYSPDNGVQLAPGGRPSSPPGVGYHATSKDGLNFVRTDDVQITGGRRWLGNVVSDGRNLMFVGTGGPGSGGIWFAQSADGQSWNLLDPVQVPGADPGAVKAKDGGWIIVSTGPPRPGTPSAQRGRANGPAPGMRGPAPAASPNGDGPWNHRILLATSKDGLEWNVGDHVLAEQASVPDLFMGPQGFPMVLFVDASGKAAAGELGALVQQPDGSWARRATNLRGADPNVVRLKDASYRAYTKERDGAIQVFSSTDGLNWQRLGEAFRDERYRNATDPDVFETPAGWVMLLSLGPRLLRCASQDGLKFVAGDVVDLGGSVSDTAAVPGGWRTYFHVNASPRTGGKMVIRSALTADGRTWRVEDGDRLRAPESGPASLGLADPAPLQLANGTWLMAVKSFIAPPRQGERRPSTPETDRQ